MTGPRPATAAGNVQALKIAIIRSQTSAPPGHATSAGAAPDVREPPSWYEDTVWRDRMRRAALLALERVAMARSGSGGMVSTAAHEAILHLASPRDWALLTARAYDRNPRYARENLRGLFSWEQKLLADFAPPPPARVLIGAAGSGRELAELAERGYLVAGFEPGEGLGALARASAGDRLLAWATASYEDLAVGLPEIRAQAPYELVILGWGSLSHLGCDQTTRRLMAELSELAPEAPVIVSWVDDPPTRAELALRAKLAQLGVRSRSAHFAYSARGGFSRSYTMAEIFALARDTGYRVVHYAEGDYPHAALSRAGLRSAAGGHR